MKCTMGLNWYDKKMFNIDLLRRGNGCSQQYRNAHCSLIVVFKCMQASIAWLLHLMAWNVKIVLIFKREKVDRTWSKLAKKIHHKYTRPRNRERSKSQSLLGSCTQILHLVENDFAAENHNYLKTWKHRDFYLKITKMIIRILTLLHGFIMELAYLVRLFLHRVHN
jgi:hypothetical protein